MLQLFEKHQIIYFIMLKSSLSIIVAWGHCDPMKIVVLRIISSGFDKSSHLLFDKAGGKYEQPDEGIWSCGITNS